MKKDYYKNNILYHKYRFGLIGNFKVFICRKFGHRMNDNPEHEWCGRCGLCNTEIYHKKLKW